MRGTALTVAERTEAIALYQSGQSIRAVAEHLGRCYNAIWRVLDDAGIPRRAVGWPKDAYLGSRRDRAGAA